MRLILSIFAVCLFATTAQADRIKLSIDQVLEIQQGMTQLDSRDKEQKPLYNFSVSVRVRIAKNLDAAKTILSAYSDESRGMFLRFSGGKTKICPNDPDPDPKTPAARPTCEAFLKLQDEDRKLRSVPQEFGFWKFTETELKLDENQISSNTLALIIPLLMDEPKTK